MVKLMPNRTVADVSDAETQYHAHEFLDATVQPKAIVITPNEVYAMHTLLSQHLDFLVGLLSSSIFFDSFLYYCRLGSYPR